MIRTLRRAQEKHAKYIGFPCVLSTSRNSRRFQNSDRQRDSRQKHFSKIHLRKSMFFQLGFTDVSEITSNGTADVRPISHEQRHRRRTICFVRSLNESVVLQYVFFRRRKTSFAPKQVYDSAIDTLMQILIEKKMLTKRLTCDKKSACQSKTRIRRAKK